jgi:molybdopterin-guanine dinucleotide biosynthesis protein A
VAGQVEPLLAVYGIRCLPVIDAAIGAGALRMRELPTRLIAAGLQVESIGEDTLHAFDPTLESFRNLNSDHDMPRR